MSLGGELIKGYKVDESTGIRCSTGLDWTICPAVRSRDKAAVSVFILRKSKLDKNSQTAEDMASQLRADCSNLIKIRHPSFLSILEPISEDSKHIAFVTEKVDTTLAEMLKHDGSELPEDAELKLNCKEVLGGLSFLHETLNSVHLNVCPENIFVCNGVWKLGGLCFLRTFFDQQVQKIEMSTRVVPNFVYSSPMIFSRIGPSCDLFSFAIVLYHVFAKRQGKSLLLPDTVLSIPEAQAHLSGLLGLKKRALLENFPADLRQTIDGILTSKDHDTHGARKLMENAFFEDKTLKIVSYFEMFLTKSITEQKDFLAYLGQTVQSFSRRMLIQRVLPFLRSLEEPALASSVAAIYIKMIECNQLSPVEARKWLWPPLRSLCESSELTAQILTLLLFYMEEVLSVAEPDEAEKVTFPFVLKCLGCNHPRTQKLALARLPKLVPKISKEENQKALFAKLIALSHDKHWELSLLAIEQLSQNLQPTDFEKQKAIFNELHEPPSVSHSALSDASLDLLATIYQSQEAAHFQSISEDRFLTVLLTYLAKAQLSPRGFDRCLELSQKLLSKFVKRRAVLKDEQRPDFAAEFEHKSIDNHFKAIKITSSEVMELAGIRPADKVVFNEAASTEKPSLPSLQKQKPAPEPQREEFAERTNTEVRATKPVEPTPQPVFNGPVPLSQRKVPAFIANLSKGPANNANFDVFETLKTNPSPSSVPNQESGGVPTISFRKTTSKTTTAPPVKPNKQNDNDVDFL